MSSSSPVTITTVRYFAVARGGLEEMEPELLERVRGELAERINRQLEAMTLAAFLAPPAPAPWRVRQPGLRVPADARGIIRTGS